MIDKQIEDEKIKLNQNLDNSIKVLNATYDYQKGDYLKLMNELVRIPELQSKFARLDKVSAIKNEFILNLYGQKSNYLIANAGIVSDYVILEKASIPQTPVSPEGKPD